MKNHIRIGPITLRVGSKHLAPWGFPRVQIRGLSLWSWSNNGDLHLAGYHPRRSITWLWYVAVGRNRQRFGRQDIERLRELHRSGNPHVTPPSWLDHFVRRDARRVWQWHDYLRLPFGFSIIIGRQAPMWRRPKPKAGAFLPDWQARIARDECPTRGGSLDTGWECNDCGFDAYLIAITEGQRPHA
jgi:hypothetical protein